MQTCSGFLFFWPYSPSPNNLRPFPCTGTVLKQNQTTTGLQHRPVISPSSHEYLGIPSRLWRPHLASLGRKSCRSPSKYKLLQWWLKPFTSICVVNLWPIWKSVLRVLGWLSTYSISQVWPQSNEKFMSYRSHGQTHKVWRKVWLYHELETMVLNQCGGSGMLMCLGVSLNVPWNSAQM